MCLASAVHVSPPGSSRASTDLLLTSFHLSSSKTGKNNLLPAVDMQTLLLQVRKQLPPRDAFKGFIACGADAACTGPVPCAVVSVSAVLLFVPGSAGLARAAAAGTILGHRRPQLQHPSALAGQHPHG